MLYAKGQTNKHSGIQRQNIRMKTNPNGSSLPKFYMIL